MDGTPVTSDGLHPGPTNSSEPARSERDIRRMSAVRLNRGRYCNGPTSPWRPGGVPLERLVKAETVVVGKTDVIGRDIRPHASANGSGAGRAQEANGNQPHPSIWSTTTGPSALRPPNGSRSPVRGGASGGPAGNSNPSARTRVGRRLTTERPSYAGRAKPCGVAGATRVRTTESFAAQLDSDATNVPARGHSRLPT